MKKMQTPECIGGHFYAFVVITMVLFFVALASGAFSAVRPTVMTLYTMDNCGPCERVKKSLVKQGCDVSTDYVTSMSKVESYPTVVYSDGKMDNGLRVFFRAAEIPQNITVIHYEGY